MSESETTRRETEETEREVEREVLVERPDGATVSVDTEKEAERETTEAEHTHEPSDSENAS